MSARSYIVGLPVMVTVDDDGTVTYDVDTSEAGAALREDFADAPEYFRIAADAEMVDTDHDNRQDV